MREDTEEYRLGDGEDERVEMTESRLDGEEEPHLVSVTDYRRSTVEEAVYHPGRTESVRFAFDYDADRNVLSLTSVWSRSQNGGGARISSRPSLIGNYHVSKPGEYAGLIDEDVRSLLRHLYGDDLVIRTGTWVDRAKAAVGRLLD